MKLKTLLSIALLFSIGTAAQDAIKISVVQDGRLLLLGDDKGNDPFTPNLLTRIHLEGYQRGPGYLTVPISYEYADLSGGAYHRYSAGLGYTINRYEILGRKVEVYGSVEYGHIIRWGGTSQTFVLSLDLSTPLFDKVDLLISNGWTDRSDLSIRWGSGGFRHSLQAGLKCKIN